MRPPLLSTALTLIGCALFVTALLSVGCERCKSAGDDAPPWRFVSESAPYQVIFPPEWTAESPESINPHADVAANRENLYFFMVIPQELPTFPSPTLEDVRDAALNMLDQSVDNFTVDRQGPLELDGARGTTVFATGEIEGDSIAYIASYVIHGDFGYQIIAFTEGDRYGKLFEEVDVILSNWQFVAEQIGDDQSVPDRQSSREGPLPQIDLQE